jgi:hypothetical protein
MLQGASRNELIEVQEEHSQQQKLEEARRRREEEKHIQQGACMQQEEHIQQVQAGQIYQSMAAALHEGKEPCLVPADMMLEWTDNFSEQRMVGEGAFGKVYEGIIVSEAASHVKLGPLAVKLLSPDMIPEGGDMHLKREIAVLSRLHHPNIIRLLGYTEAKSVDTKNICLVYEMGSRGSVGSILRDHDKANLFMWRDRIRVAHGVVSALNYLHCHQPNNPVYHRDTKSDNVVLTADYTAKLIDCGLAKFKPAGAGQTVACTTGVAVGTPGYMCRTYIDTKRFDAKSEIYSVGIFFLELVTGQVQREGISLYGKYIEDEDDIVADERAGMWQQECIKEMDELLRECLDKYKKRISTMLAVLRRLKGVLDRHCQLTETDEAKAKEMVMMQKERDEAHVKGVLADRLQRQLEAFKAELTALRQAEREAQASKHQELQEQAARMRSCISCFDECDKSVGVMCQGQHFMCAECLNSEVKEQAAMENIGAFKKARMCIKCRACAGDSFLDIAVLTRHLKEDGFTAYLRARESALIGDALREQEERAKQKIDELEGQILRLATGREAEVLMHRKKLIEDILTLKCPRQACRCAFVDFEGCCALTCHACRCAFCAYCLHDCGNDAHRHVANCKYNIAPGKNVHAAISVFQRAQTDRRTRLLRQYLEQHVNIGLRAALLEAMARDFADLGIDAALLL